MLSGTALRPPRPLPVLQVRVLVGQFHDFSRPNAQWVPAWCRGHYHSSSVPCLTLGFLVCYVRLIIFTPLRRGNEQKYICWHNAVHVQYIDKMVAAIHHHYICYYCYSTVSTVLSVVI